MNKEMQYCTVIISQDNNISNIKLSINNMQENNFQQNEYLIAIQKEYNDEIKELCNNNNIKYYEYENIEDIYYELPKTLEFDYISFIDSGDMYDTNFKEKIENELGNIIICPIIYKDINYVLNKTISRNVEIDIEKNPEKIWLNIKSAFISKNILKKLDKPNRNDLKYYIEKNLLIKLITINGGYKVINTIKLISSNQLEDSSESKIEDYDVQWYENVFNNIEDISNFCKQNYGTILKFEQFNYIYMIKNAINRNVNMKNKHILTYEKLNDFYKRVKDILKNIDDEIIIKTIGNKSVNFYLLRLKYDSLNKNIEYREFLSEIHVINNDMMIFNASNTRIKILLMDYIDGELIITATYPFPFDEKKLKIYAEYLGRKIYAEKNNLYSEYKAFGEKLYENYTFELKIPLKINSGKQYIRFFLESNKSTVELNINFNKPLSRLSKLKYAYWNCGKFTLNYRQKGILVMKNSKLRHLKREFKYIISLLRNKNINAKKAALLRILYHLTKPFYKKEIWLFEDKIYKGGDNGEYLYTYACKQKDGIKKYYILKKDCIDARRFKKENKKYVKFSTIRHKLLFLNSNIVFTTHNNAIKHHSFNEINEKYFRDLYNSTTVCIQHGLTVQYIPHLTNRINDNLKKYFLASPIEKKNMKNKEYAYEGHDDILEITGCPRYDGLKNNDKKQILITPTWRHYLALPVLKFAESRRYNDDFKDSEYFKIYNTIINDKKLIDAAKKYGYKVIYLLHPCTSSQINDYDKNDFVELIAATDDLNYEKILTESSLMVTDYSGVQFDFAYMYKPIIYFHPDELPPSYEEGEYKYETMALGEITKNIEETIDLLCEYMKNDCKVKDEYKKRIDKFFKYHDYNNCKRIYDEIIKCRKQRK